MELVSRMTYLPELIVSSPLTRALHTAELAFAGVQCARVVHPLAAERLEHSSDVRPRAHGLCSSNLISPEWSHAMSTFLASLRAGSLSTGIQRARCTGIKGLGLQKTD